MGLNSRTKSMAARVCALAKSPKSLQMDFTSQLPVTSGHCTVWQKHGHDAVPSIAMLQRRLHPCQSGSVVAMLHAVEKTFLVAQPIQLVALTSPEAY